MEAVSADQLAQAAAEARDRWHVPGIAVGLLQGGETTFAADGVRELGSDEPVAADTQFRIASITKPFVGTLAMTLVHDGLLALDVPPRETRTEATIRQLLSHQGGLAIESSTDVDQSDDDEALLRLAAQEPARLPVAPGELFSYCNTGYWLAGAAAARAAGTTFEEAMQTRVLDPLGLEATSFVAGRGAARGHDQVEPGSDEHRPVDDAYPRARRPSGGLWSTVADLLAFAAHQLGSPGPLSPASAAEMRRPLVPLAGGNYGLGWFLLDGRPWETAEHPGSAGGFQSLLLVAPEEDLAFAGLTNSSRGEAAIRELLERLGLGRAAAPTVELAESELPRFAGRYEGQGIRLDVSPADGALEVVYAEYDPFTKEVLAYPTLTARPVGEREFEIASGEFRGERIDFPRDEFARLLVLAQRVE